MVQDINSHSHPLYSFHRVSGRAQLSEGEARGRGREKGRGLSIMYRIQRRRRGRGRGRARGGRPLGSKNMDPPPELEQPNEIPKQELPLNSVPPGIGQTVSSLPLNI